MLAQKVYLHIENLAQLNDLNLDFVLIILVLQDIYSFVFIHYIYPVLLKPDFNYGNNFTFLS